MTAKKPRARARDAWADVLARGPGGPGIVAVPVVPSRVPTPASVGRLRHPSPLDSTADRLRATVPVLT